MRNCRVLALLFGLASILACGGAVAAQCPSEIGLGDCVSSDLKPTGAEVINDGPTTCTLGETISLDLRVKFDNGGGANTRYSVGFYVGDNGEPPLGGSSCTFDSLQPVGGTIDLTSGSGGFRELNGDACGDIQKGEVTYKDIALDQVACVDNNGDGQVDIGYVLTWANNGNLESCLDPLDPGEFNPEPPKCQAELELDLPIAVELPPQLIVGKGVTPSELRAPGGDITIVFSIVNASPSVDKQITINSIVDDPYGDLTNATSCQLPLTLDQGEVVQCTFTTSVTGEAGDRFPDTVTVTGVDDAGNPVSASDSAVVSIIDAAEPIRPGDLRLVKIAVPPVLFEPGGLVSYVVLLDNVSETALTVSGLVDDVYGNLDGKGDCAVPVTLGGDTSLAVCTFWGTVSGQPGDVVTDVVTAVGNDISPARNSITASDDESVTILNRRSDLELVKRANPRSVLEGANETVEYTAAIRNDSRVDTVTVQEVTDSRVGLLNTQCGVPFQLAPGESTQCVFTDQVDGAAGEYVANVVVARGVDDDGQETFDDAAVSVRVLGAPPSLEVTKLALPPIAAKNGSEVTYLVVVENTSGSADPITLTGLEDVIQDDAATVNDLTTACGLPAILQGGERLVCRYTLAVDGTMTNPDNDPLVNTVTASGVDDEGTPVSAADDATVVFVDPPLPTAPELVLDKTVSPVSLPEPGGDVSYTVLVANSGAADALPITISSLVDDIYGALGELGDCGALIGAVLEAGESASCSFTESVNGNPGDQITDTVVGEATFLGGNLALQASDTATVTIFDLPAELTVIKTATPTRLVAPGGPVTFAFTVTNVSLADTISLISVTDSVYGDLQGLGDCDFNRDLAPGETYSCAFTADVAGSGGSRETNTVLVIGQGDDGDEVQASDEATVRITNSVPTVAATKNATPDSLPPGGGPVEFTFEVSNTSASDTLTIDRLTDSVFGDLDGQGDCSAPQVLAPGETYRCRITESLSGNAGDVHRNELTASGESQDGILVSANDSAAVTFFALLRDVPAIGRGALLALVLGLLATGAWVLRRFTHRDPG
ncbi:MAG: hypothetical protein P8Y52_04765 [Xanthomonadales bacterium]